MVGNDTFCFEVKYYLYESMLIISDCIKRLREDSRLKLVEI